VPPAYESTTETNQGKHVPSKKIAREGEPRSLPYYLLSMLLIFVAWQILVWLTGESARRFLVPTPTAVVARFGKLLSDGRIFYHMGVTLIEMILGLILGTIVALLLGYGVVHSRIIAYLLEPVIVISQAVPTVALAPLLTVWFGPGLASKVVVCALIVFFPILVNVTMGLRSIDPRLWDLFQLLQADHRQILVRLEIPAALPSFLTGLKVGGTLAATGAVVGEFVASSRGLGYLVKQGQNLYDLPLMFVAIAVMMSLAIAVYGLLTLIEHTLLRWQRE
jgi:NitT/TauT family transport system permease protein